MMSASIDEDMEYHFENIHDADLQASQSTLLDNEVQVIKNKLLPTLPCEDKLLTSKDEPDVINGVGDSGTVLTLHAEKPKNLSDGFISDISSEPFLDSEPDAAAESLVSSCQASPSVTCNKLSFEGNFDYDGDDESFETNVGPTLPKFKKTSEETGDVDVEICEKESHQEVCLNMNDFTSTKEAHVQCTEENIDAEMNGDEDLLPFGHDMEDFTDDPVVPEFADASEGTESCAVDGFEGMDDLAKVEDESAAGKNEAEDETKEKIVDKSNVKRLVEDEEPEERGVNKLVKINVQLNNIDEKENMDKSVNSGTMEDKTEKDTMVDENKTKIDLVAEDEVENVDNGKEENTGKCVNDDTVEGEQDKTDVGELVTNSKLKEAGNMVTDNGIKDRLLFDNTESKKTESDSIDAKKLQMSTESSDDDEPILNIKMRLDAVSHHNKGDASPKEILESDEKDSCCDNQKSGTFSPISDVEEPEKMEEVNKNQSYNLISETHKNPTFQQEVKVDVATLDDTSKRMSPKDGDLLPELTTNGLSMPHREKLQRCFVNLTRLTDAHCRKAKIASIGCSIQHPAFRRRCYIRLSHLAQAFGAMAQSKCFVRLDRLPRHLIPPLPKKSTFDKERQTLKREGDVESYSIRTKRQKTKKYIQN